VVLSPALVCLALSADLAFGGNNIDPYIYVGTVSRLGDFLSRWPDTYYPYRFGYIIPEWLFEKGLGEYAGYVTIRFLVLGLVGLTLLSVGRSRWDFRRRLVAAVGGSMLFAMSPIVLRSTFTTYPESFAALFLVLGIGVLAPIESRLDLPLGRAAFGGALLSMSWNANPTTLPLCIVVMAVIGLDGLIEARFRNFGRQLVVGVSMLAGMASVVGAGSLVYGLIYDKWNLYHALIRQASQPTANVFLESVDTWFTWRQYLLVVPVAVLAGLLALRTASPGDGRRGIRRLVLTLVAMLLTFSYFQWQRHDPLLSIFYYSSFVLMPAWYLVARAGVALALGQKRSMLASASMPIVGVVAFWSGAEWKPAYRWLVVGLVVIAAAAVVAGSTRGRRRIAVASVAILGFAGFVTTSSPHDFPNSNPSFRLDPYYDGALFADDDQRQAVYELARQYAEIVPTSPERRGRLRVWFRPLGPLGPVNQVQAVLVHGFSALQPFPQGGLPSLTQFEIDRINQERLRFVVIMDSDSAIVDQGIAALQAALPFAVERREVLSEGGYVIDVAIMERTDGNWADVP